MTQPSQQPTQTCVSDWFVMLAMHEIFFLRLTMVGTRQAGNSVSTGGSSTTCEALSHSVRFSSFCWYSVSSLLDSCCASGVSIENSVSTISPSDGRVAGSWRQHFCINSAKGGGQSLSNEGWVSSSTSRELKGERERESKRAYAGIVGRSCSSMIRCTSRCCDAVALKYSSYGIASDANSHITMPKLNSHKQAPFMAISVVHGSEPLKSTCTHTRSHT